MAISSAMESPARETPVRIPLRRDHLDGTLAMRERASGLVIFAHDGGENRLDPRNSFVAGEIQRAGMATLLFDLLTGPEEAVEVRTHQHRLDIDLLVKRLVLATHWAREHGATRDLPIGYFGVGTGSPAALAAAMRLAGTVHTVVSRSGRPDLIREALPKVTAPTMLIVGGLDPAGVEANRQAYDELRVRRSLEIVPAASRLFEEPGALQRAAALAREWFSKYLQPVPTTHARGES